MAELEQPPKASLSERIPASIQSKRERLQGELEKAKYQWKYQLLWSVAGLIAAFSLTANFVTPSFSRTFLFPVVLLTAAVAIWYPLSIWIERLTLQTQIRMQETYLTNVQKEELQTTLEDNFFTKFVQINFRYLDAYYLQTKSQADKTFQLTAAVATISVGIVIAGVALMFFGKVEAAAVTAGAGVLSEFIATVFFYFYNRTIIKMGQYHHKLVITQNIGLAMKIAEGLPESDRIAAQRELIQRLTDEVNRLLTQLPEETK